MFTVKPKGTLAEKSTKILDTFNTTISGLADVNTEATIQIQKKEDEAAALLTEVADLNELKQRNAKVIVKLKDLLG